MGIPISLVNKGEMVLKVRDIPSGVKFMLVRNGHRFTMIGQHEHHHYLYRVTRHQWCGEKLRTMPEKDWTINGQSYAKPIIRSSAV